MKPNCDERRNIRISGAALLVAIMLMAPLPVLAQKEEPPQETHDGLTLVPDRGDGGYKIVVAAEDDVLLVRPAIIDLDITAPDNMGAGRSRTYTSSAGATTIYIELYDSVTGDALARAIDRKAARNVGGNFAYTNRVTNRADARRMLGSWADLLRNRLDEFHGKQR